MSTVDFSQSSGSSSPFLDRGVGLGLAGLLGQDALVEHGPTDLPPRQYIGGNDASSPWKPRKNLGTIPGSALDYVSAFDPDLPRPDGSLDSSLFVWILDLHCDFAIDTRPISALFGILALFACLHLRWW